MGKQLANLNCMRLSRCQSIFQLFLVAMVLNGKLTAAYATVTPELAAADNINDAHNADANAAAAYEKRNWQSLHGSWGKRNLDGTWSAENPDFEDEVLLAEHWMPYLISNANLRQAIEADNERNTLEFDDADINGDDILNEKRTWKNLNAAWGKRRNAPSWNKFRGAWGKREPGWNNLKGMWGKRSSKDWQKLNGSWGKRSQSFAQMN